MLTCAAFLQISVWSQQGQHSYTLKYNPDTNSISSCSCFDFTKTEQACKHVFLARRFILGSSFSSTIILDQRPSSTSDSATDFQPFSEERSDSEDEEEMSEEKEREWQELMDGCERLLTRFEAVKRAREKGGVRLNVSASLRARADMQTSVHLLDEALSLKTSRSRQLR